jgi:hypothetical protein
MNDTKPSREQRLLGRANKSTLGAAKYTTISAFQPIHGIYT